MNKYIRILIGAGLGAILGYLYYYYIGCSSGHCPITSNWHISTMYGALMGMVALYPAKKKAEEKEHDNKGNID